MRYFYQQMLAFIFVILVIVSTMGLTLFNFSKEQVYSRQEEQLSQSAKFIIGNEITADYLSDLQSTLDSARVKAYYFNENNERLYPAENDTKQQITYLSDTEIERLKNGEQLGLKAFDMDFNESDNDALSIFIPLQDKETKAYAGYLVLGAPAFQTEQIINSLYNNIIRGIVISSIISVILSMIFARYQNRRINRLSQATRQIAEGDYSVTVPNNHRDEFDDLANDFNHMTEALQASQEEVNRQETMRRQLMMDVAHEMRTPLTTILGLLQGMKDKVLPQDKWDRSIHLVYEETSRLGRLVNENLDYEKIRANEIVLNKISFKLIPVLEEIALQLSEEANKKATTIKVNCEKAVCVYADLDRFRQIVVNIVKNAVQFTENGEITITASDSPTATELIMRDTGMGMTKEQVENIWERFYKADISRKNNEFGESGLGLSIVKQLVASHNGNIAVESEQGVGTTFTLTFPKEDAIKDE